MQKKISKRMVEIFSRKHGWTVVELLSVNGDGTITIKLSSGQVIKRKIKRVRWAIARRIINKVKGVDKNWGKNFRTKRRRRRVKGGNVGRAKASGNTKKRSSKGYKKVTSFRDVVQRSGILRGKNRPKVKM